MADKEPPMSKAIVMRFSLGIAAMVAATFVPSPAQAVASPESYDSIHVWDSKHAVQQKVAATGCVLYKGPAWFGPDTQLIKLYPTTVENAWVGVIYLRVPHTHRWTLAKKWWTVDTSGSVNADTCGH